MNRRPEVWEHPTLGRVSRGFASRLVRFPEGTPLFVTADQADKIVAASIPLVLVPLDQVPE